MKNWWKYIVGSFTLLLAAFFYEKNKKEDAEAKLDNAETKANDGVLAQHTQDLQAQNDAAKAKAEADKRDATTQEELLKFLNKKND